MCGYDLQSAPAPAPVTVRDTVSCTAYTYMLTLSNGGVGQSLHAQIVVQYAELLTYFLVNFNRTI